jgi:hypothetical protein
MSLDMDVNTVERVLLADGWHKVENNSFDLAKFEFMRDGRSPLEGAPSPGATWRETGGIRIACPLTAILAVKTAVLKKAAGPREFARPVVTEVPQKAPRPPRPMPRPR